ncbi:MAG: efflux RND transporter periplasmic adaptor subunit [Pirellula sp.]
MMRHRHIVEIEHWARLIGLSLSCLVIVGCEPSNSRSGTGSDSNSANTAELPKVSIAKPARKDIAQRTDQPGQIESFMTTPVHAKVGGFVEKLLVEIGDRVQGPTLDENGKIKDAGQLIAILSAPELSDELSQKSAMLLQAKADVEQAAAAVKVAESLVQSAQAYLEECKAGKDRAEAGFERWSSELNRVRLLVASKTVTQKLADETLEQFRSADAARSEVNAKIRSADAKRNEAAIAVEKSKADLKAIEARLDVAHADVHRIESMREYLSIRAPFSGVVTQRNIDQGFLVQPARSSQDSPLFVVVQTDRLRVFVDVPESEAGLVENGRKAIVRVPALNGRVVNGVVSRTSWALLSANRTLRCEIDVPNDDGSVRPGMYANVELIVAERSNVLTVPKGAVIQRDGQPVCLSVSPDGTIVRKPVVIGIKSAIDLEVMSGLEGTEDLIVANTNAFKEGQKVQKAL